MRKLIVFIHSTANDIVTGPPSDKTNFALWAHANIGDKEGITLLLETMETVDTILLGRATHEDLVRKWPRVKGGSATITSRLAEKVNTTQKIVVSGEHPIKDIKWGKHEPPTQLTGADIEAQIKALKEADGGDIIIFGSPTLVQSLTNAGLIDEYHIIVHPVIVSEGERLFENLDGRTDFRLISADVFKHGAILVKYAVAKG
jgi:dihydrofolate reductase